MTTSKSMPHTVHKPIVIKLGGSMLEGLSDPFFIHLKELKTQGYSPILVHGGGPAINAALERSSIPFEKINGLRVTSKEAISIVQSTLIGIVNPSLVHQLNRQGIQAAGVNGMDGKLVEACFLDKDVYGYVGDVLSVETDLLEKMLQADVIPVVACIGAAEDGTPLNINGDTIASEIALAIQADSLLLVTDTPGIKVADEVQKQASPAQIQAWIQSGDIYGGMVPKVEAALACLSAGIPSVEIADQHLSGTTIQQGEDIA